jgi:very-short-patch-repair endonuclease
MDPVPRKKNGRLHPHETDRVVAELGGVQHDLVARWQLVAMDLGDDLIRQRLSARRWRPVRRGVYQLGTARLTRRGHWMADVLACGEGAGLGGTTVLELLDIRRPSRRKTVVITSRRGRRKPKDIDLRTSREVEFIVWDGIPITPLPRALADAAADLDDEQLEAAYEKAVVKWRMPPELIPPRSKRLNRLVRDHQLGGALTDSDLENRFRKIIKRAGLPQPLCNRDIWTGVRFYRADFIWPERKLIAEIDGPIHLEQNGADRHREADLAALGYTVQRFSRLQLVRHPHQPVNALRPFLGGS